MREKSRTVSLFECTQTHQRTLYNKSKHNDSFHFSHVLTIPKQNYFFCGKGIWSKALLAFNRKYERSLAVTSSIYTFPLSMCGYKIMNVLLLILFLFNYVMNLHEETQSVKCFLLKKIFYLNHAQIRFTINRCFKVIPK